MTSAAEPLLFRCTLLTALLSTAVLLGAQGCAGPQSPAQQQRAQAQSRAVALADQAYRPRVHGSAGTSLQAWPVDGQRQPVAISLPEQGSELPLVVYLPGLGESEQAGRLWREAWARAGYAVLSVQVLDEDARAWQSELARGGEFKTLARLRHDEPVLRQRLDRLAGVLAEARRQAVAGNAALSRIDFGRMAVAGYDLGAQSAMALAGEHAPGAAVHPLAAQFRAAIVLSPAIARGQDSPARFDRVTGPWLAITSPSDVDPTGWIEPVALRSRAFDLVPAGDKYQLLLDGAPHLRFAGQTEDPRESGAVERGQRPERGSKGKDGGGGGGRPGRGEGRGQPGGGSSGSAGSNTGTGQARDSAVGSAGTDAGDARRPARRDAHGAAEYHAAIESVSVAFLDAQLRGVPEARQWLATQVPDWLHDLGRWQQR
jgi:dienelactone hydrolase